MPQKVSVNQFKALVTEGVRSAAKERGWDFNSAVQRGFAFQLWVARLMSTIDGGFDTDPDDSIVLESGDLTADVVLIDSTRQHIVVIQCKFVSLSKTPTPALDEHEVANFFGRHPQFRDRGWVRRHGSATIQEMLNDYDDLVRDGYGVTFRYVSTGTASERVNEIASRQNAAYSKAGESVMCELYDFTGLKEYFVRGQSLEAGIPDEVEIRLQRGQFIEKDQPRPTLIALLRGNELRNLHKRHKEALFAFNIRGYLGNRGINDKIRETAQTRPGDFFYLNNGVSAICTHYALEGNVVRAKKLQIINGAQTVGTISREPANDDLEILFRLTEGESVATDRGFNRDVIECNNTQNIIKVSDFRANDPIQGWLEAQIAQTKPTNVVPKLRYVRKRSFQRGQGVLITLELLAKIRYAFLKEPTLIHSNPRALWTNDEDGGAYHKAFGVDDVVVEVWSPETLAQAVMGIVLYLRIEDWTKALAKRDPSQRYLRRLRFHALSLLGTEIAKLPKATIQSALKDKPAFDKLWEEYWPEAARVLIQLYSQAVEQGGTTMFAFVRSEDKWGEMKTIYSRFRLASAVTV
jgi:hypothetical protein